MVALRPLGRAASTRAHIATAAIPEVDDVVVAAARDNFTARAPAQSTHLARVSLERRNNMARDADVVMHDRADGMAQGQDVIKPAETRNLACAGRIRARQLEMASVTGFTGSGRTLPTKVIAVPLVHVHTMYLTRTI